MAFIRPIPNEPVPHYRYLMSFNNNNGQYAYYDLDTNSYLLPEGGGSWAQVTIEGVTLSPVAQNGLALTVTNGSISGICASQGRLTMMNNVTSGQYGSNACLLFNID